MKIIYSGGYDKHFKKSIGKSVFYRFKPDIQKAIKNNQKIAFVTFAKPDGYYDERIRLIYKDTVDIIDTTRIKDVCWSDYKIILLLGGNNLKLHNRLLQSKFSLQDLDNDVTLIGDSAGAFVLSAYYYNTTDESRTKLIFRKGMNPKSEIITLAHLDNPRYVSKELIKKVREFAKKKNLKVLKLKENQEKTVFC